jgi:hypothetical protein
MTHFLNSVCASLIVYVSITRGGVQVARALELVVKRTR